MKNKLAILISYVLLAISKSAQSIELECKQEGFAVVSDNCGVYYYCVKSANNDFYAVKFECPLGEGFSLLTLKCIPEANNECGKLPEVLNDDPAPSEEFVCPSSGRFPNVESMDCKSFYICSGNLLPELSYCPATAIFSWVSMKCVLPTNFICPNAISTTTESSVATTDEPIYPNGFVCSKEGRFADPDSVDCKSYYLCITTTVGSIDAVLSQCPSTTVFSPTSQKCVVTSQYECPVTTSPTEPSTIDTTSTTTDETTVTVELTTAFPTTDTEYQSTASESTSESTTDQNALTTPYPSSFVCTSYGRFPDPESTDCKSYYLCIENTDGFFEATVNQCPAITIFDPEKRKCVSPTDYQCSVLETTSLNPTNEPSTVETTFASSETSTIATPELTTRGPSTNESFICTTVGRFPDPASSDCKGYYLCSITTAGAFETVLTQCPSITIFSPEQNRCVVMSQYQCPTAAITSTVEPTTLKTTVSPTPQTISPDIFTCTSIGRHPDPTQPDCTKYKYCLLTATNVFLEYTFNCPAGSYFNPLELRCSVSYSCPALAPTVISEATTDLPLMTTPFYCTSDGRFPDPTSVGCDVYIMCLKVSTGSFLKYNFKCPSGSFFSPVEAKCSTSYLCV